MVSAGNREAQHIGALALYMPALATLSLPDNRIEGKGIESLMQPWTGKDALTGLRTLNLSGNRLGGDGAPHHRLRVSMCTTCPWVCSLSRCSGYHRSKYAGACESIEVIDAAELTSTCRRERAWQSGAGAASPRLPAPRALLA